MSERWDRVIVFPCTLDELLALVEAAPEPLFDEPAEAESLSGGARSAVSLWAARIHYERLMQRISPEQMVVYHRANSSVGDSDGLLVGDCEYRLGGPEGVLEKVARPTHVARWESGKVEVEPTPLEPVWAPPTSGDDDIPF